jgi:hypothetical protein
LIKKGEALVDFTAGVRDLEFHAGVFGGAVGWLVYGACLRFGL